MGRRGIRKVKRMRRMKDLARQAISVTGIILAVSIVSGLLVYAYMVWKYL